MGTSEHPPASQSQGESYLTSLLHPLLHPHSLFSIFSGSRTDNIAWPKPSSCGTLWRSDSDYSHCSVCLLMLTPLCIHPPLLRKKNHRIYPLLSEFSKYRHSRVRLPDFPLDFLSSLRDATHATLMFGEQLCVSLSPSSLGLTSLASRPSLRILEIFICTF